MQHLDDLLQNITKTGRDMWDRGWAEANGGNISLRISDKINPVIDCFKPKSEWILLNQKIPLLGGEYFLVTGTGRFLRNIEVSPERNVGVNEIDPLGQKKRKMWGFEPDGGPTSELCAHLLSHKQIKQKTNNRDCVVMHTHATNLITMTYTHKALNSRTLTNLLWKMHAECVVVFPQGVSFLPWMMAGSIELAQAMANALSKTSLVIWEYHGIVGTGRNLDEAFGRIYVAEKAAEIYLKVMSWGGIKKTLSSDQIKRIACNFRCNFNKDLLESDSN